MVQARGVGQADRELEALQRVESEISTLGRDIRRIDRELGSITSQLQTLAAREAVSRNELAGQEQALATQLRSAHAFGTRSRPG